jgi:hypothetical protein
MMIYQREPVFTIGQAPFVAGAIHVRNQIRVLKQRDKVRRRKELVERFRLLRVTLPRYASPRLNVGPSRTGVTNSPATAKT